jgi:Sec-independent protein secretion pathway component TatC
MIPLIVLYELSILLASAVGGPPEGVGPEPE